ncbi:MAG: hypothetical protein KAR83_02290 [Thermodesulfovibrionales bacterium]|nr:hypothetical protein [Thermodesulfovibrionales bacterium]
MKLQDMEIQDALKKTLETLEGQILIVQRSLMDLETKYKGIKDALSVYEPEAVKEPENIVASIRTILPGVNLGLKSIYTYANSSMREAVADILDSQPEKYFTARQIYDALMAGGKRIESDNKMQNVNIALYKFEKKGYIKSKKVGNRKGYQLV